MHKVCINKCESYDFDNLVRCLENIFSELDGIGSIIKPGMRVAIKPNLFMARKPDDAATTHPSLVKAVICLVQQAGGIATIAESPGGSYNTAMLKRVYSVTGMDNAASQTGALLNYDLRAVKIENPEGKFVKSLKILKPLSDADLIINLPKLKTHGMMVYTGAVKNMFGSVPGLEKADYHLRMKEYNQFADCLVDICLATKPGLNIIDGIDAMEGDGPGSGTPKHLGVLIASKDAFACDYAALKIMGVDYKYVPVMKAAKERGLFSEDMIEIVGCPVEEVKPKSFMVPALKRIKPSTRMKFINAIRKRFGPKPQIIKRKCISCGKCMEVCPAKVISKTKDNTVIINLTKCISCFCCHEFCPQNAVKICRNSISRFLKYNRNYTILK